MLDQGTKGCAKRSIEAIRILLTNLASIQGVIIARLSILNPYVGKYVQYICCSY